MYEKCIICGEELVLPKGLIDTASCTDCSSLPGLAVIQSLVIALQKRGVSKEEIKSIIEAGIMTVEI